MSRRSGTRLGKTGRLILCTLPMLFAAQIWAFDLDDVAVKAKALASERYSAPQSRLPTALRQMPFADYQKVRFREDHAYWRDGKTPFQLYFFHQGMHFDVPVKINEVSAKGVREIRYDPAMFDFADLPVQASDLQDLGFAGRRVLQQFDAIGRLLGVQRQRRDAKRGALGYVVAVGFQHDNSRDFFEKTAIEYSGGISGLKRAARSASGP